MRIIAPTVSVPVFLGLLVENVVAQGHVAILPLPEQCKLNSKTSDRLSQLPLELLKLCVGPLSWQDKYQLHTTNKDLYGKWHDVPDLDHMNSDKVIQAYLLSNNPANAPVMAKQVEKGLIEHLEPYIIPYRARTVKFGSPYAADNMVLLSTLSDQELKQQLPLTYYTKHAPKVVPELLRIIIAEFEQAAEDYDQFYDDNDDPSAAYPLRDQYTIPMPIILYWLVRDVLKAVIHYNQTSIAVEVKGVFEQVASKWARQMLVTYGEDLGITNGFIRPLSLAEEYAEYTLRKESMGMSWGPFFQLTLQCRDMAESQTTMFWLWTIELGRAEMNSLLRPDNLHEEDVALLTTIFCRLKLQRACAYLMEAYDTAIDDGLIIEHMDEPALATLEEMSADGVEQLLHTLMRGRDQITWMPNRFFTWDRANIHDAWVAKPVTRASVDIDLHVNALAQLSPNDRQI